MLAIPPHVALLQFAAEVRHRLRDVLAAPVDVDFILPRINRVVAVLGGPVPQHTATDDIVGVVTAVERRHILEFRLHVRVIGGIPHVLRLGVGVVRLVCKGVDKKDVVVHVKT